MLAVMTLMLFGIATTTAQTDGSTTDTACAHSIFDTRVPFFELIPDEKGNRLSTQPQQHPDKALCGSYTGKDSCCTAAALQDLAKWSDAMDAWVNAFQYIQYMIDQNPRALVDQVLAIVKMFVTHNPPIDWVAVRNSIRDEAGDFLKGIADAVQPETKKIWQAYITYQEGLLCSSCEKNFERFLDLTTGKLLIQSNAAADVSDAVIGTLHAIDTFFADVNNINTLKHVVEQGCATALRSSMKCIGVGTGVGLAINMLTGPGLRTILCASPVGSKDPDLACRSMIMNDILRGLYVDPTVIINNNLDWIIGLCTKLASTAECAPLKAAKASIDGFFYSFDTRPIVTNDYHSVDGYDVKAAACQAHLSGYACGGGGPPPVDHGSMPTINQGGLSVGAVVGIVVSCVSVALLGVIVIWRRQIRSGVTNLYMRMRDGEGVDGRLDSSSSGPLVGLV